MDLSTEYMGLRLKNPIVPSSSPLSHGVDAIRRLEDAGAAAVVMYSLFFNSGYTPSKKPGRRFDIPAKWILLHFLKML